MSKKPPKTSKMSKIPPKPKKKYQNNPKIQKMTKVGVRAKDKLTKLERDKGRTTSSNGDLKGGTSPK